MSSGYSNNGYAPHPQMPQHNPIMPHHTATLDGRGLERNMTSLERNFDRALTLDRPMMVDPRQHMLDRHEMTGGMYQTNNFCESYNIYLGWKLSLKCTYICCNKVKQSLHLSLLIKLLIVLQCLLSCNKHCSYSTKFPICHVMPVERFCIIWSHFS